jgi:6-pyruvoyltetrahydropterin/6-carboxytetrahydropterin synthase
LRIEREGALLHAVFGAERIPFLAADVKVLPLANISVEELARHFLARLLEDRAQVDAFRIDALDVEIASGPGQGATVSWTRG